MIKKEDFGKFFDQEAEAAKKSWDALMKLPIKQRIRKRKAIESVYLDKGFRGSTPDNYVLLKLAVGTNLSDFKEGEYLVLHRETSTSSVQCVLNKFEGDDVIFIEVFPANMPTDLSNYYDIPLIIDRDYVDLRQHVYSNFLCKLPVEEDFWNNTILNTKQTPTYDKIDEARKELDDTVKNFKLNLLTKQKEAILNSMAARDYYLIQGPPGTGKSFTLGLIILEEVYYYKHKVIVIGPNHLAINNTLEQALKLAPMTLLKVGQSYNSANIKVQHDENEYMIYNIPKLNVSNIVNYKEGIAIGLTPHSLYTSRARGLECDTLIIDEAGQMSLPLTMMGIIKAKRIIFAGDHKQLPPIIESDNISDDLKKSAFETLISKENCTMLDISFRMCEPICNFVSDLFYNGELKSMKHGYGNLITCDDPLLSYHVPVVILNVNDNGEQTSDLEALAICEIIDGYIKKGLVSSEIAILSPFRAQAANIRRHLKKKVMVNDNDRAQISIDTIDKMQGQEREVIIFSLAAGDMDYMLEMADFLYSPQKLNVAFSRAKSKLIIVGNIGNLENISDQDFPHIKEMIESKHAVRMDY